MNFHAIITLLFTAMVYVLAIPVPETGIMILQSNQSAPNLTSPVSFMPPGIEGTCMFDMHVSEECVKGVWRKSATFKTLEAPGHQVTTLYNTFPINIHFYPEGEVLFVPPEKVNGGNGALKVQGFEPDRSILVTYGNMDQCKFHEYENFPCGQCVQDAWMPPLPGKCEKGHDWITVSESFYSLVEL
ncbi:hypothetical protein CC80DRAFT_491005, partial [Byssothecium circinans]